MFISWDAIEASLPGFCDMATSGGWRAKSTNHHDIPFRSALWAPKTCSDSKLCYHKAEGLKQTPCLIHQEYEMGSHVWDEIDEIN